MRKRAKSLLVISVIVMLVCLLVNIYSSLDYITAEKLIYQNVDDNQIYSSYIASKNNKGVIIVTDLGVNKENYTSLISEIANNGYGVFIFDLPSQNLSEGYIPYHYNENTILAEQFYNAIVVYSQKANMPIEDIHIVAYGQGARIVLETAFYGYIKPKSLNLIGTDINFSEKLNYDIINYSNDIHLDWIKDLKPEDFSYPINLISSPMDNVSTFEDNEILSSLLHAKHTKTGLSPHSLLAKSPAVISKVMDYISKADKVTIEKSILPKVVLATQILFIPSVMSLLYFFNYLLNKKNRYNTQSIVEIPKMPQGFIRKKMLVHLLSLPIGIALGIILYNLPIAVPYKSLMFICAYSCYGLSLVLLYQFTDFGKSLNKIQKMKSERVYLPFILFLALVLIISIHGALTSFNPLSIIRKWPWMIILTILFATLFYIDQQEKRSCVFSLNESIKLNLVNYFSFWILPVVLTALGLYSQGVYAAFNLAYLVIVLQFGKILKTLYCPVYLSSILKGFLLQFMVFSQMILLK